MSAPNSPCSTVKPRSRQWAMNFSYSGMAWSGLAAPVKPGRREEVSAYRVNWDTTRRLPPTCSRLKFILPFSSSKIRRLQIFSASLPAVSSVSLGPMPSSTRKPRPIWPLRWPSMVTEAWETRVTTARMVGPF